MSVASEPLVFFDVDTQVDFMRPTGRLYVPGAEQIVPNLHRSDALGGRRTMCRSFPPPTRTRPTILNSRSGRPIASLARPGSSAFLKHCFRIP